jgi:hypothetical protein
MSGIQVGEVTHYYGKIGVAVLALSENLRVGDTVHLLGRATDFRQRVASLQIEHQPVAEGGPGQEVALKVERRVHPRDKVFKITEED